MFERGQLQVLLFLLLLPLSFLFLLETLPDTLGILFYDQFRPADERFHRFCVVLRRSLHHLAKARYVLGPDSRYKIFLECPYGSHVSALRWSGWWLISHRNSWNDVFLGVVFLHFFFVGGLLGGHFRIVGILGLAIFEVKALGLVHLVKTLSHVSEVCAHDGITCLDIDGHFAESCFLREVIRYEVRLEPLLVVDTF